MLRVFLEKQGMMLLVDTFLLYRDSKQIKHRIGPDLLLMEDCFPAPSSYDLDTRPPRCLIEFTSPKSHFKDLQNNLPLYFSLGVETYLVIDAVTPQKKLRSPIELHLWRQSKGQPYLESKGETWQLKQLKIGEIPQKLNPENGNNLVEHRLTVDRFIPVLKGQPILTSYGRIPKGHY